VVIRGPKKTFERASITQVLGFACLALSWRSGGSTALGPFGFPMRSSLQYIACMAILQHPWRETCAMAAKPLVIKQGMSSTTAGRGALSAACALPPKPLCPAPTPAFGPASASASGSGSGSVVLLLVLLLAAAENMCRL